MRTSKRATAIAVVSAALAVACAAGCDEHGKPGEGRASGSSSGSQSAPADGSARAHYQLEDLVCVKQKFDEGHPVPAGPYKVVGTRGPTVRIQRSGPVVEIRRPSAEDLRTRSRKLKPGENCSVPPASPPAPSSSGKPACARTQYVTFDKRAQFAEPLLYLEDDEVIVVRRREGVREVGGKTYHKVTVTMLRANPSPDGPRRWTKHVETLGGYTEVNLPPKVNCMSIDELVERTT